MPNGTDLPVYQEWDHILLRTSYHSDYYYRVFFGTVDWERNGNLLPALTVFYQRGNTEDWEQAKRQREVVLREPAHIMPDDLDDVVRALQTLRQRRRD